jgi:transaldolase
MRMLAKVYIFIGQGKQMQQFEKDSVNSTLIFCHGKAISAARANIMSNVSTFENRAVTNLIRQSTSSKAKFLEGQSIGIELKLG